VAVTEKIELADFDEEALQVTPLCIPQAKPNRTVILDTTLTGLRKSTGILLRAVSPL